MVVCYIGGKSTPWLFGGLYCKIFQVGFIFAWGVFPVEGGELCKFEKLAGNRNFEYLIIYGFVF
jgi:hypothetical protein